MTMRGDDMGKQMSEEDLRLYGNYLLERRRGKEGSAKADSRRAIAAYWAYRSLQGALEEVPAGADALSGQDQQLAAVRDLFHAAGIDLHDPVQRDVLVIFVKLVNSLCADEDELVVMLMASAELALSAEENLPGGR